MCTTLKSTTVRIRKDRRCFGCETVFTKGSELRCHLTRGDGRLYSIYLCERCDKAAANHQKMSHGECFLQGELREFWDAHAEA